ncbi:MAG: ABC transporter ATP-binding protein [Bacteroidales bacterium]
MLGWMLKYSRGARGAILITIIIGVVSIVAMLGFVATCKSIIDIATGTKEGDFFLMVAVMGGIMLVDIILAAVNTRVVKLSGVALQNRLRHSTFLHLLNTCWRGREQHHSGDMMTRIEGDIKSVTEFVTSTLPGAIVSVFQFCGAFAFLLLLDKRLAMIMVFILPIALVVSKVWYKRMKRLTHEVRNSDSQIHSHIQEGIQHKLVVKTSRASEKLSNVLDGLQSTLFIRTVNHTRFMIASRAIVSLGFAAGYLVTFSYGAYQLKEGLITYGVMIAFLQLVAQVQRPVSQLASVVSSFSFAATAADRLDELNLLPIDEQGEELLLNSPCGVEVRDIKFIYDDGTQTVLDKFSCNFPIGSRTIVVGETGAGKTTLFRLLLALVKPINGEVLLYNNVESVKVSPLTRLNFIYVPQGNTLFSGSIRNNLLMVNANATDDMLRDVLHTAVADFVWDLPDGVDTVCGEDGGMLSEGQAQRIAIARGLLSGGSVLLFDEFSSALDSETERELMQRLIAGYRDKTMIFITHRLESFADCEVCRIK